MIAFIGPVILIFLINLGFLIMAAVILWKLQQKRPPHTKSVKSWIKAVASLTIVMGFTWMIGLIIVEEEKFASLAYFYTTAIAFQGLFIFLILVVLTKSVRDDVKNLVKGKFQKMLARSQKVVTYIKSSRHSSSSTVRSISLPLTAR